MFVALWLLHASPPFLLDHDLSSRSLGPGVRLQWHMSIPAQCSLEVCSVPIVGSHGWAGEPATDANYSSLFHVMAECYW